MAKKKKTQEQLVMEWIARHGSITQKDAISFGCYRLAARISDLRRLGVPIVTVRSSEGGATFARYRIEE